ncbi:GNAT family N-acetyltransferase [Celerinatantimonas sp. YJH-8]|uniref:GNAT family N-acetyltransferase n=1 Tax=Celerinatantimonas sp. YJH-8 TaxID=3228714 RepID=UPI0038BEB8C9
MSIRIRPAHDDDVASLLLIEQRCFTSDRIERRQMYYLLRRAKASFWVAEQGCDILGYVVVLRPKLPRRARIYSLAVLPEAQRQGVASTLLHHVLDEVEAASYQAIGLEVRCSALRVQALYQRFGFRWTHLIRNYYGDGADGWKMVCQLPRPEWSGERLVSMA